ncbi:MAG: FAD-binding oxidoreductase [Verrucomicrobia bacterium]|nr:FAD-binding oxidoreductase [Verrucomicrobiota bacterium]
MTAHVLIIGGGLAGTSLAWRLHERGVPFLVVDRDEPLTSSKVAAGLITPITGMRLVLNWRLDTLYPEARAFYQQIEKKLGHSFYHETPIVSLLLDDQAVAQWQKRHQQPEVQPYLDAQTHEPLVNADVFANPLGGFQQRGAWLDTAAFLAASQRFFESTGRWQCAEFPLPESGGPIHWNGQTYKHSVYCIGWEAAKHPWFEWLPFRSGRGTVLQVQADTGGETRIINRGCWLLPRSDGTLRVGPTYEFHFDHPNQPAPEAVAGLETKLQALLKRPYKTIGSQTGVRPIIQHRQAVIGRHPVRPDIAFMNGLGSKGVLRAPWLSRQLIEHLLDGKPIEAELDLAGNF